MCPLLQPCLGPQRLPHLSGRLPVVSALRPGTQGPRTSVQTPSSLGRSRLLRCRCFLFARLTSPPRKDSGVGCYVPNAPSIPAPQTSQNSCLGGIFNLLDKGTTEWQIGSLVPAWVPAGFGQPPFQLHAVQWPQVSRLLPKGHSLFFSGQFMKQRTNHGSL